MVLPPVSQDDSHYFTWIGLKDKHLKNHMYMITAVRLTTHRWKNSALLTMKKRLVKMMELAEVAKLTSLIREKSIVAYIADWKFLMDFLCNTEKMNLRFMVLMIQQDRL
uniref:Uncharacterized protein n=1 Tax=Micrurus lemniscatus lemniscatus TaxID=129467 RepID=A0A2D4J5R1_MICLE